MPSSVAVDRGSVRGMEWSLAADATGADPLFEAVPDERPLTIADRAAAVNNPYNSIKHSPNGASRESLPKCLLPDDPDHEQARSSGISDGMHDNPITHTQPLDLRKDHDAKVM